MTVKLELSEEVQARVEALAHREGMSVEVYLQRLIERFAAIKHAKATPAQTIPSQGDEFDDAESAESERMGVAGEAAAAVLHVEDFTDWERDGG